MATTFLAPTFPASTSSLAHRGDFWFFLGCLVCGTWIFGVIGAPMVAYGMYLMRQAQLQGDSIRPWSVTVVGGLLLVDASVNYLAYGLDFFPSHYSTLARSLWIDYGMFGDGAYALNHNSTFMGGVSLQGEKAIQTVTILLVMPIKIAAAYGFLQMKRWGLQWAIIANWLYLFIWVFYPIYQFLDFEYRFGAAEFGVLGFWLIGGIPFLGPIVLLPYLHSVNRELWTE